MKLVLALSSIVLTWSASALSQDGICSDFSLDRLKNKSFVSIAFANQSFNTPVSMFGHTFLVFHSNPIPEPDSITLEFTGMMEGKQFAPFKALVGTLEGKFLYSCLYLKQQEYDLEDRDLWLYQLNFKLEERLRLNEKLGKLIVSQSYGLLDNNCASRTYELLTEVFKEESKPLLVHLPVSGLKHLLSLKRLKEPPIYLPSSLRLLNYSYDRLTRREKEMFSSVLAGTSPALAGESTQETLSRYVNYRLRREADSEKRKTLFSIKKETSNFGTPTEIPPNPLENSGFSVFELGYVLPTTSFQLAFSPGIQNFWNSDFGALKSSSLEFGRVEGTLSKEGVRLQNLTVFSLDAPEGGSYFDQSLSRHFSLSYKDWGSWFAQTQKQAELRFGVGYGHNWKHNFSVSLLPILSVGYFDSSSSNSSGIGVEMGVRTKSTWWYTKTSRMGLTIEHQIIKQSFRDYLEFESIFPLIGRLQGGLIYRNFNYSVGALGIVLSAQF